MIFKCYDVGHDKLNVDHKYYDHDADGEADHNDHTDLTDGQLDDNRHDSNHDHTKITHILHQI